MTKTRRSKNNSVSKVIQKHRNWEGRGGDGGVTMDQTLDSFQGAGTKLYYVCASYLST